MEENKYPEYIMRALRQRRDLEEYDTSEDEYIYRMSPNEVFSEVCEWEGFLGYTGTIRGWIEAIYGIDLDEVNQDFYRK